MCYFVHYFVKATNHSMILISYYKELLNTKYFETVNKTSKYLFNIALKCNGSSIVVTVLIVMDTTFKSVSRFLLESCEP